MTQLALHRVVPGLAALLLVGGIGGGCSRTTPNPEYTATEISEERATPDYWWDKENPVRVPAPSFDRAVAACEHAARERFFEVDRVDARAGLVTTKPMTAAQWFEPWRRDNTTLGDVTRSSLDTYRRTVRFNIKAVDEANLKKGYVVVPQVLVERQTLAGRRLTSVTGFRQFTSTDQSTLAELRDANIPAIYWYSVARDNNLEYQLGKAVVNAMH